MVVLMEGIIYCMEIREQLLLIGNRKNTIKIKVLDFLQETQSTFCSSHKIKKFTFAKTKISLMLQLPFILIEKTISPVLYYLLQIIQCKSRKTMSMNLSYELISIFLFVLSYFMLRY
jgi:hypothetical protein